MATYYNRYQTLNTSDQIVSPPFVKLDEKDTDDFMIYDLGKSRLDKASMQYYDSPYYGWLILMANPIYKNEWEIPDGQPIRIPLPLQDTLTEYKNKLKQRLNYYG